MPVQCACAGALLAYIADQQGFGGELYSSNRCYSGERRTRMSYVDAALAPQRKTVQIKLHGPCAFAGMRLAGRLGARCPNMLTPEVKPGVPADHIDGLVFEFAMDHKAVPAT